MRLAVRAALHKNGLQNLAAIRGADLRANCALCRWHANVPQQVHALEELPAVGIDLRASAPPPPPWHAVPRWPANRGFWVQNLSGQQGSWKGAVPQVQQGAREVLLGEARLRLAVVPEQHPGRRHTEVVRI